MTQKGVADTNKTLFVGAHYDSAVAYPNYQNLEALDDNASGSGVLTELTRNLNGIDTEHNIQFVAFGAVAVHQVDGSGAQDDYVVRGRHGACCDSSGVV